MKQKAVQKWSCSLYRAQRNYEVRVYVGNMLLFMIPSFVPCNRSPTPLNHFGQRFAQLLWLYIHPGRKKDLKNPLWAKTVTYFNVVTWVWACWVFRDVRYPTQNIILSGIKRDVDFGGDEEKGGQCLKGESRCNGRGIPSDNDSGFCYRKV